MFEQLKSLFSNRRTTRLVSNTDIPQEDLDKIMSAIELAPSFNKDFAYKVYVLTNSPEGISKKQRLVEYARCGVDKPGDPWDLKEINLSILGGALFVFTYKAKRYQVGISDPFKVNASAAVDATICATMTLLSAESLGYSTAFTISIWDTPESREILTTDTEENILLAVSVSNKIPQPADDFYRVDYRGQRPYIVPTKHHDSTNRPNITVV